MLYYFFSFPFGKYSLIENELGFPETNNIDKCFLIDWILITDAQILIIEHFEVQNFEDIWFNGALKLYVNF